MNSNSTDAKQIRRFGAVACLVLGSLSSLWGWAGSLIPAVIFGSLALIGLGLLLLPNRLRVVYSGWMTAARWINTVLVFVMLTLAYYLVITPAAWIKSLIGGKPLPLKPDRKARSYWVIRSTPVQPKEQFGKRF